MGAVDLFAGDEQEVRTLLSIEGRLQTERRIREAAGWFAPLVEGLEDYAVFMLDAEGRVATWNAGAERIQGYKASEIIGCCFSRFYPPEGLQQGKAQHDLEMSLLEGGYGEEGWRTRKDGSRFWARVLIRALRGPEDGLFGFVHVVRDMTERKYAEEVLRESEERFRLVEQAGRIGCFDWKAPESKLIPSLSAEKLYGLEPGAFDQRFESWLNRVHPEDRAPIVEYVWNAFKERQVVGGLEFRICLPDGEVRWMEVRGSAIYDDEGNPLRVLGVSIDVTERKKAEEVLREGEERFRSIVMEAPIPIMIQELDGKMLALSRAFTEVTGYTLEDIPNGRKWLRLACGMTEAEAGAFHEAFVQKQCEAPGAMEEEHAIRTRTGEVRCWFFRGSRLRRLPGSKDLMVSMAIDITDRKRAEESARNHTLKLQQLTQELEERVRERTGELLRANEALRDLSARLLLAQEEERKRIAGEIHDTIGTSLSTIKFKVEAASGKMMQGAGFETVWKCLNDLVPLVQESVEECRRIQTDLRPAILDDLGLVATLSWFCRRFQTIYSESRVEQEVTVNESDIPKALKIVVYRVLQEAMNNIAKHSKANLVRLVLRKTDGKIELVLHDNGRGFNPDETSFLDGARRGLGLKSMRERVELSGGSFSIESSEGNGTVVRAEWPISLP